MSGGGGGNENMKTATTKTSGGLDEIVEPVQVGLTELRKKVRNLEKKKSRLDALREEVRKSGKPLNEDQSQALARYEDNNQQLETCRELCRNFETCASDIQKCFKKILKKNELAENGRLFDLEKYRAIMHALDSDDVVKRYSEQDETFQGPQRQQVKLLRKILLPLRSDFQANDMAKSWNDYLKAVTDQQANLVHGRPVQLLEDEAVPEAKTLLDRLVGSQFFSNHPELLFVKALPSLGSVQQERVSSSGGRPGSNQHPQQSSPSKQIRDDHQGPASFLGNSSAAPGFHYSGEPIPSTGISFTNSKLTNPTQPSVAQPAPSATSHNVVHSGSSTSAHSSVTTGQQQHVEPTQGSPASGGHPGGAAAPVLPRGNFPISSPAKEAPRPMAAVPVDVIRRQSESDQVSQNQTAWQSGRPFGTFDPKKPHGDEPSISPDAFPSTANQENRLDADYDSNRGPNGLPFSNFNGVNQRVRGNGRPYEHQPDRRSFDGGRGGMGGRRFDDGRGDSDLNRGSMPGDRGMQRGGSGQRGGRFMGNDNRGPRGGNGQDFDGGRDDGGDHGDQQQFGNQKPQSGSSGNDADFGVFHVDNPSFKGRTGNGNYGSGGGGMATQDDRRSGNFNGNNGGGGIRRGPRGGPPMGARRNYGGNGGRYGDGVSNGGYEQ